MDKKKSFTLDTRNILTTTETHSLESLDNLISIADYSVQCSIYSISLFNKLKK